MKNFVITIVDNPKSMAAARKCIESGKKFGIDVEIFPAITPADKPIELARTLNIPIDNFKEVYSRFENCLSAFLSHYHLWLKCRELNEEITIFEHDAIIVNHIPDFINHVGVISLGAPSYGKYNTPTKLGPNPLTSKRYFPGAHAYRVSPHGQKKKSVLNLLMSAHTNSAAPTDLFLGVKNFPWIEEYYPWPVICDDSFTTIQNKNGCLAKHNYGDSYEIV